MKTQSWAIFARVRTDKCSAGCNYDDSLEDDYCLPFFKLKFLIPYIASHILFAELFKYPRENVTLQVPFRGISWENIHFCDFLKNTYIANGGKIKVNSPKKYVQLLSSGYFLSSYISPLIDGLWKYCNLKEFTTKQNKKSDLILENNIFNLLKLVRNPHLLDAREALLWKFQLIFLALHAIICAIIHAKDSIINTGTIT